MRYLIAWIRSNPVTVASVAVAVVSLAVFAFLLTQRTGFRDTLSQRTGQVSQIDRHINANVDIPPERPDAASDQIRGVTITPRALEELEALYERMNREYEQVLAYVTEFNRRDDLLFLPDILPDATQPRRIAAREAYRSALQAMLEPPSADADGPRLNAGGPPPADQLRNYLDAFERDFRESRGQNLTPDEQQDLERERGLVLRQQLQRRAQQLGIYAQTDRRSPNYPFHIPAWSTSSETPRPQHLWEGQLELWIIQDILYAIADANGIPDGNAVTDAPVKRLLRVEVLPGYVGLHTLGGLNPRRTTNPQRNDGAYPPPAGGRVGSPNERVSDNFNVGPTARVSNVLYDVRHARLEAVVASHRLPELFRSLGQTNFMTVLAVDIENVDEYAALRDGFVYGADNVVRANILIESIWLRQWTEPLMPEIVRQYLGIDEPGPTLLGEDQRAMPDDFGPMY